MRKSNVMRSHAYPEAPNQEEDEQGKAEHTNRKRTIEREEDLHNSLVVYKVYTRSVKFHI